jgi:hypothetical protein
LQSSVYRKPTHTGRYLHFESSHSIHIKSGAGESLVNRASVLCQNEQDLKAEMYTMKKELLYNAYPTKFVASVMHKKSVKEIKQINSSGRFLGMVSVPYCTGVSKKSRMICYLYKIKAVFKAKCTLGGYLRKTKPKLELLQKSRCVYKIRCECGRFYNG